MLKGYYSRIHGSRWSWFILYNGDEVSSGTCDSSGAMKEVLGNYDFIEWELQD